MGVENGNWWAVRGREWRIQGSVASPIPNGCIPYPFLDDTRKDCAFVPSLKRCMQLYVHCQVPECLYYFRCPRQNPSIVR